MQIPTHDDPRWALVCARDAQVDGLFYYGVITTDVYCRPSCPSRQAKPEHVRFFETQAGAQASGFRACKRCRPDDIHVHDARIEIITQLCRRIAHSQSPPTLTELAAHTPWSPSHLQKCFRAHLGLSPRDYAQALSHKRIQQALDTTHTRITDAIFEAGFQSVSQFYARSDEMLGMTPSTWRARGRASTIVYQIEPCAFGYVLIAVTDLGVCATLLGDDTELLVEDLARRFSKATRVAIADHPEEFEALSERLAQIVEFVDGDRPTHGLPLDIQGTAFQHKVWKALLDMSAGETCSYAELAQRIGKPGGSRAVAQACGKNAIAIAIPCHRVIRGDGELAGYRWGIERKQALLQRESKAGKHRQGLLFEE